MNKNVFYKNIINKILCHKNVEKQHHCIKITLFSKQIFLCSRCLGLYPFAILFLILSLKYKIKFNHSFEKNLIFYSFLPLFIDWSLTSLNIIKSNNLIRFSTGLIASCGLARWWYLYIIHYHIDIFWYILKIYSFSIGLILLILIFQQ